MGYNGATLILLTGSASMVALFVIYARFQNAELWTPDATEPLLRLAGMFYVMLTASFGAIGYGMYLYHRRMVHKGGGLLGIIAARTWNTKSRRIFVITFVVYGVFFSMASGMLVYQPEISFSYHYGVPVPSAQIIPCCDDPGYKPSIQVYITDHVGLQIVPINLVLQIIVSYLVGLNMSLAASVISVSRRDTGLGTIGALTGLFIACPTCAGTFLSLFVGAASGIAAVVVLTQLQTVFIAVSIPVLLATPFIMARRLQNAGQSCAVSHD